MARNTRVPETTAAAGRKGRKVATAKEHDSDGYDCSTCLLTRIFFMIYSYNLL